MGETAERVAVQEKVTRQEMDEFACLSQERASQAVESGVFEREISPVTRVDGALVSRDDCPRPNTSLEKLAGLKPVFREDGRVTAGNACPLNDGAAALVIMSDRRAKELGIRPLARILSTGLSALRPEVMGLGPIESSRQALARAGLTINDVDLVELNEAFAAVGLVSSKKLGFDDDKVNVNGGAIAMGHPVGMSGARIVLHLALELQRRGGGTGAAALCGGGGQGDALILRVPTA